MLAPSGVSFHVGVLFELSRLRAVVRSRRFRARCNIDWMRSDGLHGFAGRACAFGQCVEDFGLPVTPSRVDLVLVFRGQTIQV